MASIPKSLELSEATFPLLRAHYQWLRKINGVQNKSDVIIQNTQLLQEFIFICEHDLLFFLTVTGRFDEIHELFKDKSLFAKIHHLLESIRKERAVAMSRQEHSPVAKSKPDEINNAFRLHLEAAHYANCLTHMRCFRYYHEQIIHVSMTYYARQTALYRHAYDERLTRLRDTLDRIGRDPGMSAEDKELGETIYKRYIQARDQLFNSGDVLPVDVAAAKQQFESVQAMNDQLTLELQPFFDKLSHNPQVLQWIEQDKDAMQTLQNQVRENYLVFDSEVKQLTSHLMAVGQEVKRDIDKSLNALTQIVEHCPRDELRKDRLALLDDLMAQLKGHQTTLKNTDDFNAIHHVLVQCSDELKKIVCIIEPVLPQSQISRFSEGLQVLIDMSHHQEDDLSDSLLFSQKKNHSIPTAPAIFHVGDELVRSANHQPPHDQASSIRFFGDYREVVKALKGSEQVVGVNEEQQILLEEAMIKLDCYLVQTKNHAGLSQNQVTQLAELDLLNNQMKAMGVEKINQECVQSLCDALGQLESHDENFIKVKESFDLVMEFFSSASKHNI